MTVRTQKSIVFLLVSAGLVLGVLSNVALARALDSGSKIGRIIPPITPPITQPVTLPVTDPFEPVPPTPTPTPKVSVSPSPTIQPRLR